MDIKASIICCTLNREKELEQLTHCLKKQTFKDYELILCTEEGNLVELKNNGAKKAKGEILIWIDDDIYIPNYWLETIMRIFKGNPDVAGVTGPTYVSNEFRNNRDILRNSFINKIYNALFLYPYTYFPGIITPWGANTIGANFNTIKSQSIQEVDFLEPSQFAIRKNVFESVGGFDLNYGGVAEWCDVDLCFRIASPSTRLLYHPLVWVKHNPVKGDKVYNKRLETKSRYQNYLRFSNKFIEPSFRHGCYKSFLKIYYYLKGRRII